LRAGKRCMCSLIGFDQNRGGTLRNPRPVQHAATCIPRNLKTRGVVLPTDKSGGIWHGFF
jgi:hypothetical protein